ncbi:hypothetical protein [Macrococcus capreoli]|uniref:hypothetical protein n=1 Tax=Macrococcus capreoli TaxID=2982690 RepID=UPI0021D60EE0|nr:hypothetical protein [Macrococcus sp. TMW 2.2395]MCU7556533.1 hypothetical protein [Macrococcus sp. TMW 2.2395]
MVERITYKHFIIGLRVYLEELTGVTCVWRYPSYIPPEDEAFIGIELVNSGFTEQTKLNDLVAENIYLNIANYAKDVVSHADTQGIINEVLLYHTIPLMNEKGEILGQFSVSRINSDLTVPFGTLAEDETNNVRSYTDFVVELAHVKINEN